MASKIKAIGALRPRVELGETVQKDELVRYIARVTNLSEGQIDLVIKEIRDAIIFFNLSGRGIKIDGLGTFAPKMDLNGRLSTQYTADIRIKKEINSPGAFLGKIANRDNIGKTGDDLVAQWNLANPGDPVT